MSFARNHPTRPPMGLSAPVSPKALSKLGVVPGVVEVRFKPGVAPTIPPHTLGHPLIASTQANMQPFNALLQQRGALRAEHTFRLSSKWDALHQHAQSAHQRVAHFGDFVTLHFPALANTALAAAQLRALPMVERAAPVPRARPAASPASEPMVGISDQLPDDPPSPQPQWYLHRCRVVPAWKKATGHGVVIVDLDFGFRTTHEDIAAAIERTYNSWDDTKKVDVGPTAHGTAVVALAAARANDAGMAGVAPEASVWAVQAGFGNSPPASEGTSWQRGIEWALAEDSGGRRKVLLLEAQSIKSKNYEQIDSVNNALRTAIGNGVVVVVAAGNGGFDARTGDDEQAFEPTGSILVGATVYGDTTNDAAWWSNHGADLVAAAPGDQTRDVTAGAASDTHYMDNFGGTSGAAAKVAGVVALMLEAKPDLTHEKARSILKATGSDVKLEAGKNKPLGKFVDAEAAVIAAITAV